MAYLGSKVKEDVLIKLTDSLEPWFPSGEFIAAVFKVSQINPLADYLVVTNMRLLTIYIGGLQRGKGVPVELTADEITGTDVVKNYLVTTLKDGARKKIGLVRKEDSEVILKALNKISGTTPRLDINEQEKEKNKEEKNTAMQKEIESKRQKDSTKEQQKLQNDKAKEQQKLHDDKAREQQIQAKQAHDSVWDKIIVGKVNHATLVEVRNSCNANELPKYILGDGINGSLAIFENRCIIIKKGLGASFMAGSLGGGRTATFLYKDITGIEYNSGILTGVLEVLTASYSGKETNSPWSFGTDKSAHELSNTLPWDKVFYNKVRSEIEWLKQKVSESKHSQGSIAVQPAVNFTDELAKLSDLHKKGILTDDEFQSAKTKILNKM